MAPVSIFFSYNDFLPPPHKKKKSDSGFKLKDIKQKCSPMKTKVGSKWY